MEYSICFPLIRCRKENRKEQVESLESVHRLELYRDAFCLATLLLGRFLVLEAASHQIESVQKQIQRCWED